MRLLSCLVCVLSLSAGMPMSASAQMAYKSAIKKSVKTNQPVFCWIIYTGPNQASLMAKEMVVALRQPKVRQALKGYLFAKHSMVFNVNAVKSVPVKRMGKQGVSFFVPGGTKYIYNLDVGFALTGQGVYDKVAQAVAEGTAKVNEYMKVQKEILDKHKLEKTTAKELKTNYEALLDLAKQADKGGAAGVVYTYVDLAMKLTKKNKELDKEAKDKRMQELLMLRAGSASRCYDHVNAAKYFGAYAKAYPKDKSTGNALMAQAQSYAEMSNYRAAIGVLNKVIRNKDMTRNHDAAKRLLKTYTKAAKKK